MERGSQFVLGFYGLFFAFCLIVIVVLIIKRVNKKNDFEDRDN